MRWFALPSVLLVTGGACVFAQKSVDSYLATESPIAKAGLLANIGPSGSKSSGAASGIVIASPNTVNPNYLFTWVRDSSLTFQCIIDQFTQGQDTTLRSQIDNFVEAEAKLQQITNPSGGIGSGGLGEPKFNIDGTAFTGPWGRPQRDGPALRSTALITWANYLRSRGNTTYVSNTLWPVIQRDLNYVAGYWNQTTFDLWEEINSSSFYTTAVQHRSLRLGATFASVLGQSTYADAYTKAANDLLCFLQSYWNPSGYVTSNTGGGRSGKDANSVLASIHTFDPTAGCDAKTFQPCSDRALSNHLIYVKSFSIYDINSGIPSNQGSAVGRYPEDVYFGGNPWVLATLAAAEQLYDALIVWNQEGSITVTSTSLAFFTNLVPGTATGTYTSSSAQFASIITAVKNYADSFVAVVAKYTPSGGGLAEQYSRSDGAPLSAADLTWNYAALLTANSTRAGNKPSSWGAQGLTVPPTCQTPSTGSSSVAVTFKVTATTSLGQNIYLAGSLDQLAQWSSSSALLMSSASYPVWSVTVNIPANTYFEYKYINSDGSTITWESGSNNFAVTPRSGPLTLNDSWRQEKVVFKTP